MCQMRVIAHNWQFSFRLTEANPLNQQPFRLRQGSDGVKVESIVIDTSRCRENVRTLYILLCLAGKQEKNRSKISK